MQPFPPLSPGAFPKEHTEKAALQSVCSPCLGRVLRCSARNRIRVPQIPIPDSGRSPDFDHRCFSLPGFPVVCKTAPVHSDCIVPDSHRILYSPPRGGTSAIQFYIFSDIADYSIPRRIVNEESAASLLPFVLMVKTPSISPKACHRYLIFRVSSFLCLLS